MVARLASDLGIQAKTVEGWCQFDDEHYGSDRPWDPHTWIEIPDLNLYIDITADQFNYGMAKENEYGPVIVQQGLPHGMRYDEPTWAEYGYDDEEVDEDLSDLEEDTHDVSEEDTHSSLKEKDEASPTITRSPGVLTGYGYIVGGGMEGCTKALDDCVKQAAELLREHYGLDVTIRFNSNRMSGGAWVVDSKVDSIGSNSSIGLGAGLFNSELQAMPQIEKLNLSQCEFDKLFRSPDSLNFNTYIDLRKTEHQVPEDSKYIDMFRTYEYRTFSTLEEASSYLFTHVIGLCRQEVTKDSLVSKIVAADQQKSKALQSRKKDKDKTQKDPVR